MIYLLIAQRGFTVPGWVRNGLQPVPPVTDDQENVFTDYLYWYQDLNPYYWNS